MCHRYSCSCHIVNWKRAWIEKLIVFYTHPITRYGRSTSHSLEWHTVYSPGDHGRMLSRFIISFLKSHVTNNSPLFYHIFQTSPKPSSISLLVLLLTRQEAHNEQPYEEMPAVRLFFFAVTANMNKPIKSGSLIRLHVSCKRSTNKALLHNAGSPLWWYLPIKHQWIQKPYQRYFIIPYHLSFELDT